MQLSKEIAQKLGCGSSRLAASAPDEPLYGLKNIVKRQASANSAYMQIDLQAGRG
jgi:hypothetical protein